MKVWVRLLVGVMALAGAAATAGGLAFVRSGVSARQEPSAFEAWAARSARDLLIPGSARSRVNPLPPAAEQLGSAREHFVEHCVQCHGRDGRGDTPLGRGLHPRVPDLTLAATQDLPDGTLFWIIENGVRLTGMPAFGMESPEDDEHAWQLVLWIRRLPELTPEEIEAMAPKHAAPTGRHGHAEHGHDHR